MRGRLLLPIAAALVAFDGHADPAAWRIEGPGGGSVVLLGSVHTLREGDYPLPESIDRLYEGADSIVMELDMDDLRPDAIQAALLGAAMLPPADRLADVLSPALYRDAETTARDLGLDLGLLDRFEPWLVAITMLDLGMTRLGYRSDRGIEQYLLGRAREDGKPVEGLESLATQVAVFDSLSLDEQGELLEQTLLEIDTASSVMSEMIAAWRDGRLDELTATLLDDFQAFPDLYASLVVDRNTDWTGKIEQMLNDRRAYLIVVGGLHLVGDDSVIRMLAARGHDAERLTN